MTAGGLWLALAVASNPAVRAFEALDVATEPAWRRGDPVALEIRGGTGAQRSSTSTSVEAAMRRWGVTAVRVEVDPPDAARAAGCELGVIVELDPERTSASLVDLHGGLWTPGPPRVVRIERVEAAAEPAIGARKPQRRVLVDHALPSPGRCIPATVGDWVMRAAALEPLYRATEEGLQAVLAAGPYSRTDDRVLIPIRASQVDHTGAPIGAIQIAGWLRAAIEGDGCALDGGRVERVRAVSDAVELQWTGSDAELNWFLADPALRYRRIVRGRLVGSGPFALSAESRLRARSPSARIAELSVVAPRLGRRPKGDAEVAPASDGPFTEVWYLQLAPALLRVKPELAAELEASLHREGLLRGQGARVRPVPGSTVSSGAVVSTARPLRLSIEPALPAMLGERLQFDLLRLGVRAELVANGSGDLTLRSLVALDPERVAARIARGTGAPGIGPTPLEGARARLLQRGVVILGVGRSAIRADDADGPSGGAWLALGAAEVE